MSFVGGLLSGASAPAIGALRDVLTSKELTKRTAAQARVLVEVASAAWRPWMARLVGWTVLLYTAGTLLMMGVNLIGIVRGAAWATGPELPALWERWLRFGGDILQYAMVFIGAYAAGRSAEKAVKSYATATGPKRREVARSEAEAPERVERLPGVRTPAERRRAAEEDLESDADKTQLLPDRADDYPRHGFEWTARSRAILDGAHHDLQRLFDWVLERTPIDFGLAQSVRDYAEQVKNFESGASLTMESRHLERPAMAVDFFVPRKVMRDGRMRIEVEQDLAPYRVITDLFRVGSEVLDIPADLGIDFRDARGEPWPDGGHVQLARDRYPVGPMVGPTGG